LAHSNGLAQGTSTGNKNNRTARKSAQRFHHFYDQSFLLSAENVIILVSFGIAILLGSTKNLCFIAVGIKKCMLNTLKERYFFWMVLRFAAAPALLSLQTNLAVMSQTSAFI
jgi:hypothetical protein